MSIENEDRIENALHMIRRFGGIDGEHHKTWVIDQITRCLCGCPEETGDSHGKNREYEDFVAEAKSGENGPETYDWNEGIAP